MDFKGFYNKSLEERKQILSKILDKSTLNLLTSCEDMKKLDLMIENVIGRITLPLGILTNFKLNGKQYMVPMAIEEPSVVAAANKASKLTLPEGFFGEASDPIMIGTVYVKANKLEEKLLNDIDKIGYTSASGLEKYGGGWRGFDVYNLHTNRGDFTVIEFYVDCRDAMGANTINTIAERIGVYLIENGMDVRLRILTNNAVKRTVTVKGIWKKEVIGKDSVEKILDAYSLALFDKNRLVTNNKGVMNGIDAVALATGQDWRAIEAGIHNYMYEKPLVVYHKNENEDLVGTIHVPLAVATVGGATNTLSHAKASLKLLGVKNSMELAMIMAGVGLANNFAAIYALVNEGIQKGHMKLHSKNIAILAGARDEEEIIKLSDIMIKENNYSLDFAKQKLKELRDEL